MTLPEHFGLFPQRKTVYIKGKQVVYRALIIDALETRTDDFKDTIFKAFDRGDPRLTGLQIVPVTPTKDTDITMIALAASNHTGLMNNTTHHTIRGFKTLDLKITNKSGEEQTLWEFFATILIPIGDIRTQLIQRTERATDNSIYLIHLKDHSPIIKKQLKTLILLSPIISPLRHFRHREKMQIPTDPSTPTRHHQQRRTRSC